MSTYSNFVHLRVHSSYSLSEGAIMPYDMAKLCAKHQMPAVAITDSGNLFGSLEFSQGAASTGIQPIIGVILAIDCQTHLHKSNSHRTIVYDRMVLLAKDKIGYDNLLKLVSRSYTGTNDSQQPHISLDMLCSLGEGLIILTGGVEGPIGRLLLENKLQDAEKLLLQLKECFGDRLYIEIMRHNLESEIKTEEAFLKLAYTHNIPLVATNDVYFATRDIHAAHDALLCIAEGRYVTEEDRRKVNPEHYFKTQREMTQLFHDLPEAIENTYHISLRCAVMSPQRQPILPRFGGQEDDEKNMLRTLSREGLMQRLVDHVYRKEMTQEEQEAAAKPYLERLDYELDVIIKMNFSGYFLIVSDFMRWGKRNDVPIGPGRGSGAGSVVAWALEITDLDPLRFGLLFERFLNPERVSMPDFDIDFCQEKREKVIRYVQERYGSDKVAQIITFGKLQARAVIRDVGRVLQMPYGQIDRISKMIPVNPIDPVTLQKALDMDRNLRDMQRTDPEIGRLIDIALKLEGLNRHCSTHAAGVVIADRPLEQLVPVYRDPRSDMPICGYSMKYAESAGLVKFDFLGLKTLTVIAKACEFIARKGIDLDISRIPLDDRKTYDMLAEGKSVGVFQLESAGMRDVLRKLRPDTIDDIIALISLYRPGPMDNIPSYIARKHGLENPDYLHPMLTDILKETYGVIIYQEQVMQIAQVMGGYSLGSADLLRRAMGKKIASEMDKQRDIFVKGAIANKVDKEQASFIFDLVAKFAGYGFNKSHAAAYAMISYRTAYLKANYPVEFFAASMNLDIHDTDQINTFVQDIREHGIHILPPDINASSTFFTPEICKEKMGAYAIRYGLGACKNVGISAMQVLEEERSKKEFTSIFEMVERLNTGGINKRMLESLVRVGAFDRLHPNRRQLFENIELIIKYSAAAVAEKNSQQISLFSNNDQRHRSMPELKKIDDWEQSQRLQEEFSAMGLYLTSHPLLAYQAFIKRMNVVQAGDFNERLSEGYSQIKLAAVVISKRMRSSPKGKFATITMSDPTGIFELSIYDESLLTEAIDDLETGNALLISADARKDEGGVRMIATSIELLEEVVAKHSISYTIHVDSLEVIEQLKRYLPRQQQQEKNININFYFKIDGHAIVITLPPYYSIGLENIMSIKAYNGVTQVEEEEAKQLVH